MEMTVTREDLPQFATSFWAIAGSYKTFALHGQMGAGKTTLVSELCRAKGVDDVVGSPTFSIINQYAFSESGKEKKIYHIDLYRLKDEEEIVQAGVEDSIYSDAISFVEWPEKAPQLFDENTVHVYIDAVDAGHRNIKIILPAPGMKEQS